MLGVHGCVSDTCFLGFKLGPSSLCFSHGGLSAAVHGSSVVWAVSSTSTGGSPSCSRSCTRRLRRLRRFLGGVAIPSAGAGGESDASLELSISLFSML